MVKPPDGHRFTQRKYPAMNSERDYATSFACGHSTRTLVQFRPIYCITGHTYISIRLFFSAFADYVNLEAPSIGYKVKSKKKKKQYLIDQIKAYVWGYTRSCNIKLG